MVMDAEKRHIIGGRCKSGKRWFWIAAEMDYDRAHKCDDPVCIYGGPHEYGWEDSEELALKAMTEAVTRLGGEVRKGCYQGNAPGRASEASGALKRINAARRRARPPKPGATGTTLLEYLYEPWSWTNDYGETSKGINEIPIVKKTAKRIYYDNSDSWDRSEGVITLGYISREDFETDTRCRETCVRDIPAGLVCGPHGRDFAHCIHWGVPWADQEPRCRRPDGCGERCPLDTPGKVCAAHRYITWDHCPHGHNTGGCYHGSAAGVGDLPGRHYRDGGTVYATRQAAEDDLYAREREQERKQQERERQEPEIKRLRMAMANVHPDRGGTNEQFIAARERYEQALRRTA